jgi:hypothetical protein
MNAPSPWVVMRRVAGGVLVGHVAVGNAVAGLVQSRAEAPMQSYTAAVLGAAGECVHGGNGAGVVCAALEGAAAAHGLVPALLSAAATAEAAVEALRGLPAQQRPRAATLLVADAQGALLVEMGREGTSSTPVQPRDGDQSTTPALCRRLREAEPTPREGAAPVSGLAALLVPGEAPRLHFALGPPSCAVFIRHWPGMELVPGESAGPEGAPLARLAAAVAQATGSDPELRERARQRLDRAEAEALAEGEAAEAMAARMDADTDDRGAAVRRLVAQSYAAELARQALEELAVPARPRGSGPGTGL